MTVDLSGWGGLVAPATTPVVAVVVAVPAQNPQPPPGRGEEFGKASPIALVVVLLLALVTAGLVRSMTKRIKRLPESFDPPADDGPESERSAGDAGGPRG